VCVCVGHRATWSTTRDLPTAPFRCRSVISGAVAATSGIGVVRARRTTVARCLPRNGKTLSLT